MKNYNDNWKLTSENWPLTFDNRYFIILQLKTINFQLIIDRWKLIADIDSCVYYYYVTSINRDKHNYLIEPPYSYQSQIFFTVHFESFQIRIPQPHWLWTASLIECTELSKTRPVSDSFNPTIGLVHTTSQMLHLKTFCRQWPHKNLSTKPFTEIFITHTTYVSYLFRPHIKNFEHLCPRCQLLTSP